MPLFPIGEGVFRMMLSAAWAEYLASVPLPRGAEVADGGGGWAEPDFTLIRWDQPGQDLEQGGLACAVGTDQAGDLAGGDNQVDAGEKKAVGMAGGKALGREYRAHRPLILDAGQSAAVAAQPGRCGGLGTLRA